MDNYDDEAFKRRDLNHLRAKEMLKHTNPLAAEENSQKQHSKSNQRIGLNSSMNIVNPSRFVNKYREKEFHAAPSKLPLNTSQRKNIQELQKVFSRDERLKVPKSSQIQSVEVHKQHQPPVDSKLMISNLQDGILSASKRALNRTFDKGYKTPSKVINIQSHQDQEGIGSKRKRQLQIANQFTAADPFIKNRLQTQAAYIQKHLKPSSLIFNNI